MDARSAMICPEPEVLQAYGLGKIDDASAEVVLKHLESCPQCLKFVADISGDSFLARLWEAQGRSVTPAPAKGLSGVSHGPAGEQVKPAAVKGLPPELANHSDYTVLRELGRGGMGVVYLAQNRPMDRLEVLKVVNQALLDRPGV